MPVIVVIGFSLFFFFFVPSFFSCSFSSRLISCYANTAKTSVLVVSNSLATLESYWQNQGISSREYSKWADYNPSPLAGVWSI